AESLLPNFPVKPFVTRLSNISGKVTYALSTNNKLIGYGTWGKKTQPNRLDTFLVAATAALHNSADSTWNQAYWAHTYKGEWDSVVSDRLFFEIRGGQFHYKWPNTRYTEAPAYADLSTNIVSGGNRDGWFNIPTRNQVLGSFNYFKDGWAGSHNLKIGGEVFDERFDYLRGQGGVGYVPGNAIQILQRGLPSEVLLFLAPTASLNGLKTYGAYINDTWRTGPRLTVNLGVRFDRYRSYLPAQSGPPPGAAGRRRQHAARSRTQGHGDVRGRDVGRTRAGAVPRRPRRIRLAPHQSALASGQPESAYQCIQCSGPDPGSGAGRRVQQ